ncbi:MAG: phosphotransferase [Thiothrix sp.]|nr:phosphotransferase [Thiothrix sp.]
MIQDLRLEQLTRWVQDIPGWEAACLQPASVDASFRRYFRASRNGRTAIVMDSPPDREDPLPFVDITRRLLDLGIHAPAIMAQNLLDGFLLLEDLGNTLLLDVLMPDNADSLYREAMTVLLQLQRADTAHLAHYGAGQLGMEMRLMPEWFLQRHLGYDAADQPVALIRHAIDNVVEAVTSQPYAFMHRDFHSRNLMLQKDGSLAVIDYQGAVSGPVTYDLVSLLRDCYITWPEPRMTRWALMFHKEAIAAGNMPPVDETSFLRWFDLTGLQRHIKVLGIFCRLFHRDGKPGYLKDLPRVLDYVIGVGLKHPETANLAEWMRQEQLAERIGVPASTPEAAAAA